MKRASSWKVLTYQDSRRELALVRVRVCAQFLTQCFEILKMFNFSGEIKIYCSVHVHCEVVDFCFCLANCSISGRITCSVTISLNATL